MKKAYLILLTTLLTVEANAQSFPPAQREQNSERPPVQVQTTAQSIDDIIALSIKTQDAKAEKAKQATAIASSNQAQARSISAENADLIQRIERIEKNINNFAPTMSKNMQDLTSIKNNADSLIKDVGIQLQDLKNAIQMNELRYSELLSRVESLESKSGIPSNQMQAIPLQQVQGQNMNSATPINFNTSSPIEQELQKMKNDSQQQGTQQQASNAQPQDITNQNQQTQRRFTQFTDPQPQQQEYIPLSRNQIIIPE